MSTDSPTRKRSPKMPAEDRRVAAGAAAPLRRLKGLLVRPVGLERRGGQLHVVLVERRRARPEDQPPSLSQLRAELRARLLAHEDGRAAQVLRHLGFLHDELGRKGWRGVEALPAKVLGKALAQAEMLGSEEPSPALALLLEQLRPLHAAAELRDERAAQQNEFEAGGHVEVSEATHEEFDAMERSWVGTVPAGLSRPERDD
jgi:hypothetical protein